MKRRNFAILLAGAAIVSPIGARAQQRQRVYRVGVLGLGSPALSPVLVAIFKQELQDLGYIEGQNIVIEYRWTEGKTERLPDLAIDLVAQRPDVIVAITSDGTRAAKQATTTIPIVMAIVADPVGSGFVTSLAHPGGNITGVTDFGIEMVAKHVELIHALLPNVTRIGVLMSDNPVNPRQFKAIEDAAKALGLEVVAATNKSNEDLESAFASMTTENAKALVVLGGARHVSQRYRIAELATEARLPTVFPTRLYVEAGGLLSYGPSLPHTYKLAAVYVDKILKGAKPADLPVQQPTTFNMVINMKTAKALGLTIPQSVLLRADEVIQ